MRYGYLNLSDVKLSLEPTKHMCNFKRFGIRSTVPHALVKEEYFVFSKCNLKGSSFKFYIYKWKGEGEKGGEDNVTILTYNDVHSLWFNVLNGIIKWIKKERLGLQFSIRRVRFTSTSCFINTESEDKRKIRRSEFQTKEYYLSATVTEIDTKG